MAELEYNLFRRTSLEGKEFVRSADATEKILSIADKDQLRLQKMEEALAKVYRLKAVLSHVQKITAAGEWQTEDRLA